MVPLFIPAGRADAELEIGGVERTTGVGADGMNEETVLSFSIAAAADVTERSLRCEAEVLKPVAITVIFTSSFIFSSSTAPKLMLASSCAALWMMVEASFTSDSFSELEPVILMRMPRAK